MNRLLSHWREPVTVTEPRWMWWVYVVGYVCGAIACLSRTIETWGLS